MACRLIWSPAARDDLHEIVRFIARDNPQRAESFGYELMRRTDILQQHPEAGRIVPGYRTHSSATLFIGLSHRLSARPRPEVDRDRARLVRSTRDSARLSPSHL